MISLVLSTDRCTVGLSVQGVCTAIKVGPDHDTTLNFCLERRRKISV